MNKANIEAKQGSSDAHGNFLQVLLDADLVRLDNGLGLDGSMTELGESVAKVSANATEAGENWLNDLLGQMKDATGEDLTKLSAQFQSATTDVNNKNQLFSQAVSTMSTSVTNISDDNAQAANLARTAIDGMDTLSGALTAWNSAS